MSISAALPLLVVAGAQALAIAVFDAAWGTSVLCALLLLAARPRLRLVLLGLALGTGCWLLAPDWIEPPAGLHALKGRVVTAGFVKGRYEFELADLKLDGQGVRGRALMNLKRGWVELAPGARISLDFEPRPSRPSLSGFDYRRHLLAQGICLRGELGSAADLKVLRPGRENSIRQRARASLEALARPEAEILLAALLGIKGGLTATSQDEFNSLGITHLIAISGFNFALVMLWGYLLTFQVARVLSLYRPGLDSELLARCGGLACIWFYWLLVEPAVPSLRAALMAVCLLVALIVGRRLALLNVLGLAAILILLRWPLALYTPSFLLSFGAVFGMLAAEPMLKGRPRVVQFGLITFIAGLYTLPVIVHVFGFAAPLSLVWNLVLVPVYSLGVMPLAYLWLLLNACAAGLAAWLLPVVLAAVEQTLNLARHWGAVWPLARPPLYLSLVWGFALIALPLAERREALLKLLAPFVIVTALWSLGSQKSADLHLDVLPAGSNAVVLATKHDTAVLVASGSLGFARYELAPYLLRRGIRKIDLVVMPRPVASEVGGLSYILARFKVGELWVNVGRHRGSVYDDVITIAKKKSVPVRIVARGDSFVRNDLKIKVLNPQVPLQAPEAKLDSDLHTIILDMRDTHLQALILAKTDPRAQLAVAAQARRPMILIHCARQRLESELAVALKPDLLVTAEGQTLDSCSVAWRDQMLIELKPCPQGLRVKLGSHKADGYYERVLTVPVTRGGNL